MGNECRINEDDYPGLFRRADRASLKAQKVYLRFERGRLGLLILGSPAPILYALLDDSFDNELDGVVLVVMLLIVGLALLANARRDDETWFDCRAIAESTKTAA